MQHIAPRRGLGDITSILDQVAKIAGQVQSGAQLAAGGVPVVSFWDRNKWPIVIASSTTFGAIAAYLLAKRGRRR